MEKNYPIKAQKNDSAALRDTAATAELERLMPYSSEATRFSIVCRRSDYSAGRIARAIEDCDAHVLNLNLTADSRGDDDTVVVDVRVDRKNISSIARSLARYDYVVDGVEDTVFEVDDSDRMRVAELLRMLDV